MYKEHVLPISIRLVSIKSHSCTARITLYLPNVHALAMKATSVSAMTFLKNVSVYDYSGVN